MISILRDNDQAYFNLLSNTISQVDKYSGLEIIKTPRDYKFRVTLTEGIYFEPLLKAINELHTTLGINIDYSKSMKRTATIDFKIETNPD